LLLPPRPICSKCFSSDFEWVNLKGKGKLLTYTVIHVSYGEFQSISPYVVGIVKLEEGPQIPGIIRVINHEKIRVDMDLIVDFNTSTPSQWPFWPRYFFKLMGSREINSRR
jgi:uncharacterized OB-fold protein